MMPIFEHTSAVLKLFILLGLLLFGALIGMLTGLVLSALFYGLPVDQIFLDPGTSEGLQIARMMQICGQLGLFVFPPLFYSLLVSRVPLKNLGFNKSPKTEIILFGVLTMYICLPLIHFLGELNHQMHLPESMAALGQWMTDKEEQAALLSEQFLQVTTISGLVFNLFMIAIIPAIGEELLFRGALQPLFIRLFKNVHLGIFITSLLFGMMHLQFFGLLPRVVLGLFMGYYFYYSKSLWVPILMHFVNNGTAVIVYYLNHNGFILIEMESFGAVDSYWAVVLSLILVSAGIVFTARKAITKAEN
jgi:membrane protease YdiL (CAAX protease family)